MRRGSRSADRQAAELELTPEIAAALRSRLPAVAGQTVAAVIVEVPGYAGALSGRLGRNIESAVQLALGGFLDLVSEPEGAGGQAPVGPALEGAHSLGRGEARSGRTVDALLAAYRVGARVAWREFAAAGVERGLDAATLAKLAELVFAYIDELSAASVSGHTDELAASGRERQRHLERLSHGLLTGAPADVLEAAAKRAEWAPPRSLTALLATEDQMRGLIALLDPRTLEPGDEVPGVEADEDLAVLLVPDAGGEARAGLLRTLRGRQAVVGPACEWLQVRTSYERALRARRLEVDAGSGGPVDTDDHLAALVLGADQGALDDLRARVLAPILERRPSTAQKLSETLRSWLLHHGRRDDVATELFVHPQTVRYRMGQLRELYGERLDDPRTVLELTLALATAPIGPAAARPQGG